MDIVALGAAYGVAAIFGGASDLSLSGNLLGHWAYGAIFLAVWVAAATDQRLYVSRRSESMVAILFTVAKASFTALLFSAFVMALALETVNREFYLWMSACSISSLLTIRLAMGLGLWNLRRRGFNARRILIIGANERAARLVAIFQANEQYGYHIEGILEDEPERAAQLEHTGVPYLGPIKELERLLLERVLDSVYIALPVRSHYEKIQSVAHLCEGIGVPVRLVADLFPLRMATSYLTRMGDIPLLSLAVEPEEQTVFALRRAEDVLTSLVLLILLLPVFLVLSILLKLESRGPLFTQRPMRGPHGEPISVLAFRTTKWRPADAADTPSATPNLEFTRAGKYLELYGLDELPELLDVLRGRLNLAGPVHPSAGRAKMDSPV
ncbi:MAG: sugar transferase [Candidatus Hydrogenedentes bacterium]|nr:sugar transferase [Candidatus Hydrogenedentota bacterium]